MTKNRKYYKKIRNRKNITIRKSDVFNTLFMLKTNFLTSEKMIKSYKVRTKFKGDSKYLLRLVVTTMDNFVLKYEIIKNIGGK